MSKQTVREFLTAYSESQGYGIELDSLLECMTEGKKVWRDPNTDQHRWYICQDVVVDVEGTLIKYTDYIITGDNGMADMDLEYDIDSASIVEKKTREVIETYYE